MASDEGLFGSEGEFVSSTEGRGGARATGAASGAAGSDAATPGASEPGVAVRGARGPWVEGPDGTRVRFDRRRLRASLERARAAFETLGYGVALNTPYSGGFVTAHYGRPADNVHALQIEINRDLYMDETQIRRGDGLPRLARDVPVDRALNTFAASGRRIALVVSEEAARETGPLPREAILGLVSVNDLLERISHEVVR